MKCNIARLYLEVIVQYLREALELVIFITVFCSFCKPAPFKTMIRLFKESFRYVIKHKKNTDEYDKKTPLLLMCALSFQRISRENTCMKSWLSSNYRHSMGVNEKTAEPERKRER